MIVCMGFALTLSLHASVPSVNSHSGLKRAVDVPFATPAFTQPALAFTARPADNSFYEEFYPATADGAEQQTLQQPKTGVLHKLTSLIKKAVKFRL
jgi:hypothetical protein